MDRFPAPIPAPRRDDATVVRRGFWRKVRRATLRTAVVREAAAAYVCAFDPKTPARVKLVLLAALAYFVMPADAIPDFVAGLGFTDDIAVLFAAIRAIGPEITDAHRDRAKAMLDRVVEPNRPAGES